MKNLILLIGIVSLLCFQTTHAQTDYLKSATHTYYGTTTDNSKAWTNVVSVTIDVTNVSYVMLTASINMKPSGTNDNGREANYNIYRSDLTTDESGVIKRQILRNSETGVESWGIGTLVHIFDVGSLSGNKTYTLEHSNQGGSNAGRNVYSSARLTAVALTTATSPYYELSNDVIRLGETGSTTTSITYADVANTTTDAITLPIKGDIFVIASINGKASASGSVAEYKLESSTDGGTTWADLGKAVKRSMINSYDDGIVSLTCVLQDQDAGNFMFRIAHRRVDGGATITTHNCNIVAVALAHSGGGYFPSFCSEVDATGVGITGASTAATTVTSTTFTAAADIGTTGTGLFVSSQFLVSASNLDATDRMRAGNQLYVSGASSASAEEYYRYISDNSNFGAGGFIGLMTDLEDEGSYTIGMKHQIAHISGTGGGGDETLTTSNVILTGFQTYDHPSVSGSYDIGTGGDYTSLSNADGLFADINATGLSDNVTANIISDITETGANKLDQWTEFGGSGYTLTIQPDATTLRTLTSTTNTPVYFNGADRVTINGGSGKYLTFKCTNTTPGSTEAVFFFVDGATSNTITNCNIESNVQEFTTNPAGAAIEIVASGGTSGGDNEVTISNCNIYNSGTSAPLGCGIYINSWNAADFKNTVTISNNNIYNFAATTASNVACGIYVDDEDASGGSPTQTATSITGNSFYCNLATAPTSNQTAILIDGGVSHTVTGNYIGGQSASCGGSAWSNTGADDDYLKGIEIRFGPTGTTYDVSDNTIQNINTTTYCWVYYNHKASVDFSSNTIGHAFTANSIITSESNFWGIFLADNNSSIYVNTIEDNIIANIQTCSIYGTFDNGIYINAESNIDILKNKIYNIGPLNNSTPDSYINGICISVNDGTSTYTIANNVVSLGAGLNTDSDWATVYLVIPTAAIANLYYNSLFLDGSASGSDEWTCCVYRENSCTFVSKNNIIYNSRSDAVYDDEVYNFGSTGSVTSNNNILYAPDGVIAYYNSTTYTTLANWQGDAISPDANSAEQDPQFTNSSSNPPDLSLLATNEKGTYLSSYLTDIDGVTRNTTTPDAGAYEYWAANWTGTTDSDWNKAGNWDTPTVPTSSVNVEIPNVSNDPIVDEAPTTPATCKSLLMESDAILKINAGKALTVSGNLTVPASKGAATLTVESTSATSTGSLIVKGTASGNVTVERFLTHDKWHYIAGQTNISGNFGTSLGLSAGANNDQFYRWDEALTSGSDIGFWVDILNGNGSGTLLNSEGFVACKGYAINYITNDKTLSLSGVPFVADQSINITKTTNSTNEGANLVGNPFTSTIAANNNASATSFLSTNINLLDATNSGIYLWDEQAGYTGNRNDYETISNTEAAKYIAVGQAFMIVKRDIGPTSLPFNTNMREHGSATFYKDAKQDEVPRFYMNVENDGGLYNEILIAFIDGMTNGLDISYDAGKLKGNPNIALYTKLVDDIGADFAHQALPPLDDEVVRVKTGLDVSTAGNYTFKINELQNFDEAISIKLEDKLTGSLIDFRQDGEYSFFINTPGEIRERFVLHFNGVTGIEDDEHITKATVQTYGFNNTLYILNPEMKQGTVTIYNLTGQKVATFKLTGDTKQQQTLNMINIINIVKIQTGDGVLSQKVIFR